VSAQGGDGIEQLAAVPDNIYAKILQVLRCQVRQERVIDAVLAECSLILSEAKAPQPISEVHGGALTPPGAIGCLLSGLHAISCEPVVNTCDVHRGALQQTDLLLMALKRQLIKTSIKLDVQDHSVRRCKRPQALRPVGQPEPAALGLLMGNLQPLTLPDTLDPLVVDDPARLAQELGDLAIAIAAVLPGKLDNIGGETLLVVTTARDLALRRAMLPERRTGATLGDMQLRSDLLNAGTATRGA